MQTTVIIPTYNEAGTIKKLLLAVRKYDVDVLVVDDNSPDGTGDLVREAMKKDRRIHILTGTKLGLGTAYRRGMQYAVDVLKAEAVMEMDADYSHAPKDIPRLLKALETTDFVIGSRYVPGGKINGWGPYRKLVSWGGNLVARTLAGLFKIHDCTAGFRAIRMNVLKHIDWNHFPAKGYGFQIALLHHAQTQGHTIAEVPVTFTDRRVGESKLGTNDIIEFIWLAAKLGCNTYKSIIKFLIVGATGIIVNIGLLSLLVRVLGLTEWLSLFVAIEASILWNYAWHETWTFRDRKSGTVVQRAGKYHLTSLLGIVINAILFYVFYVNAGLFLELANLLAIGVATLSNYVLSYFWAWKKD